MLGTSACCRAPPLTARACSPALDAAPTHLQLICISPAPRTATLTCPAPTLVEVAGLSLRTLTYAWCALRRAWLQRFVCSSGSSTAPCALMARKPETVAVERSCTPASARTEHRAFQALLPSPCQQAASPGSPLEHASPAPVISRRRALGGGCQASGISYSLTVICSWGSSRPLQAARGVPGAARAVDRDW